MNWKGLPREKTDPQKRGDLFVCVLTYTGTFDTDHFSAIFSLLAEILKVIWAGRGANGPKRQSPTDNRTQGRCFGQCFHSQISSQDFAKLVSSLFPGSHIQLAAQRTITNTRLCLYIAVKTHPAAFPVDTLLPQSINTP